MSYFISYFRLGFLYFEIFKRLYIWASTICNIQKIIIEWKLCLRSPFSFLLSTPWVVVSPSPFLSTLNRIVANKPLILFLESYQIRTSVVRVDLGVLYPWLSKSRVNRTILQVCKFMNFFFIKMDIQSFWCRS